MKQKKEKSLDPSAALIVAYLDSVQARLASLRGRMSEAERQVEGLFESLLNQSFGG